MKLRSAVTTALILAVIAPQAFAWGQTGHRAIGEIAEKNMRPEAVLKAKALLDGQDLAFAAGWADDIKSDRAFNYADKWHYTTWEDDDGKFHSGQENGGTGLLMSQIERQLAVLRDAKASKTEKAMALRFTVHLVGDLHQPLHVGGGGDQGGNFCKVTWHGRATNLHRVWDSDMIDSTDLSFTELARFAGIGRSSSQSTAWRAGSIRDWAAESRRLRGEIYPAEVISPLAPVSKLTYCQKDVAAEAMPKLGYEYSYRFLPVLYERVYQAGLRLGKLLDENL
jgi:hypothetical protein